VETTQQVNADQIALWNGCAGRGWVEAQGSLDRLFEPFEELLVEAVAARGAHHVLDVGCGTGSTTLVMARQAGAQSGCVGIDISEPMIALARTRAHGERSPARFVCADAQTYAFAPASFDLVASRFGVMFFDDSVRAFANLRCAMKPGGALQTIAWRAAAENPFMTAAERAAARVLPQTPVRRADEPGQFAFADRERVRTILQNSGWAEIAIRPLDVECVLPTPELETYLTRLGPLGRVLPQLAEPARMRVMDAVRAAFEPYVVGPEVRFTAACWMIGASATE
jgi:ubiquinone/menaquinone biosynthesis C-methylase UbiE